MDTEFGVNCNCHPLIKYEVPGLRNTILKMQRDGNTLNFEINADEDYELISVRPGFDWFALHDIKKGEYVENKRYPYRKYVGIFNPWSSKYERELRIFLEENKYEELLNFKDEFTPKDGADNSTETMLQVGNLMQDLDYDMFKKIKKLREMLVIGDLSLFDNLASVCYDDYTDEVLSALLGINRQKMKYQNGADNLFDSYYEIGISSCFFPLENQKSLLKK